MTSTTNVSRGPIGQAFGLLFIVIGVLSYAIAPRAPLGVFAGLASNSPDVTAALLAAHNFAHDALFIVSAAVGVVAMWVLSAVYGKRGTVIGASFVILSILVLLIEPAILRGALGATYGAVHTPWHIATAVLQVLVGAAAFGMLRTPKT